MLNNVAPCKVCEELLNRLVLAAERQHKAEIALANSRDSAKKFIAARALAAYADTLEARQNLVDHYTAANINSPIPGGSIAYWKGTVLLEDRELAKHLEGEIRRRWPEEKYLFHIEVIGGETGMARVWDGRGIRVTPEMTHGLVVNSVEKNPNMAAVLHGVHVAVAEAVEEKRSESPTNPFDLNPM